MSTTTETIRLENKHKSIYFKVLNRRLRAVGVGKVVWRATLSFQNKSALKVSGDQKQKCLSILYVDSSRESDWKKPIKFGLYKQIVYVYCVFSGQLG